VAVDRQTFCVCNQMPMRSLLVRISLEAASEFSSRLDGEELLMLGRGRCRAEMSAHH
jgi:hypothetical protein